MQELHDIFMDVKNDTITACDGHNQYRHLLQQHTISTYKPHGHSTKEFTSFRGVGRIMQQLVDDIALRTGEVLSTDELRNQMR